MALNWAPLLPRDGLSESFFQRFFFHKFFQAIFFRAQAAQFGNLYSCRFMYLFIPADLWNIFPCYAPRNEIRFFFISYFLLNMIVFFLLLNMIVF